MRYTFIIFMASFFTTCSLWAQEIHDPIIHNYRVYNHYLNPREHPDDKRRYVKPPSWELFSNQSHFTVMRRFQMDNNKLVRFAEDFDLLTLKYKLGDVIWPHNEFLSATNIPEMVKEMKRRNLFLFDIWGYVPGSGPGFWQQYELSEETSSLFTSELGDKWLGMDMGEQDGRYLLAYARSMYPAAGNRSKQYLYFHKHMSKIAKDMRNKLAALVAVTYGHYLLKEGFYTMLGAETAQMHPNGQVFYSFIRGAGKQYGVPWFGNASVYNRWGWKSYENIGERSGPTKGTSLSLLKRLLYSHILYNCMIVGFESGWTDGEKLSPIGKIQRSARQWVIKHGSPGVHQTPIALMTDFYAGWIFPNYNNIIYRVWGNIPYGPGDYLTNNVFDMFYPGYQESSFFHDESGFAVETPFGDNADALLSDAPQWLLNRYSVLVIAGELSGGLEIKDKLTRYVEQGGNLFITSGSIKNLPGGIAGIHCGSSSSTFKVGSTISIENGDIKEKYMFELADLLVPEKTQVLAKANGKNAVIKLQIGKGFITVFASPHGISASAQNDQPITRIHDKPLINPYPMLDHVRIFLESAFKSQQLFEVDEGLALITCRKGTGEYTLGISNNNWNDLPLKIVSNIGEIVSARELPIDGSDKKAIGYLPEGMEGTDIGKSDKNSIEGGDIRIFRVKVKETNVSEIPLVIPISNAANRVLPLSGNESIQTQILNRPTFFQHFDGVLVDWKYIHQREEKILLGESGWLKLQNLNLWVDLTSGINLFPDLRLVNNIGSEYERSMETIRDVIKKMNILGAENLIISLHKPVENNIDRIEMLEHIEKSVREICEYADLKGITVHLRTLLDNDLLSPLPQSFQLIEKLNKPNLKLALNTASLIAWGISADELKVIEPGKIGVWMLSTPEKDLSERLYNINAPVAYSAFEKEIAELLLVAPDLPLIHDILLENPDQEYEESREVDRILEGL